MAKRIDVTKYGLFIVLPYVIGGVAIGLILSGLHANTNTLLWLILCVGTLLGAAALKSIVFGFDLLVEILTEIRDKMQTPV